MNHPSSARANRLLGVMDVRRVRSEILRQVKAGLVTGGSAGLGLGLARMLREDGYELTLVARRPEPLQEAAEALEAHAIAANLADTEECVRVVTEHRHRFGRMDVLVNSAGLGIGGSFGAQDTKRIALQLDVNLRGTMIVTREALPLLRASKGHVVTLASIAGTMPVPGLTVYGATKAALISFTSSLNREEAENGVRAVAICPGFVATKMTDWTGIPAEEMIQVEDVVEIVRAILRLGPRARIPQVVIERVGDEV
jgi:short-subunit dehydrogenase